MIVLCRNAQPEAILVGRRERKRLPVKLGRITICQPEVNILEFVHGGLRGIASPENCVAFLQQVRRSLDQGEADVALWERIDVHSSLYTGVVNLRPFALRDRFHTDGDPWLMNFPKGLDDFLSSLCRDQRSKLRRKYKRLLNRFADRWQIRQFCSVGDLEAAISIMEGIAGKSVKRRRFGWGFFDTPELRQQMLLRRNEGG